MDWFGSFSNFFLLVGLCASLRYFYFSIEQKGAMGRFAKFGVWVLMIGFGASFGFTVQGRLSLAVDRVRDVLGKNKEPAMADQIAGPIICVISIVIIVVGIAVWEIMQKRKKPGGSDTPSSSSGGDSDLPAY